MVFIGAPFVVENVHSLMNQLKKLGPGHLQMVRLHDGLVDLVDKKLAPDFFSQSRVILFQKRTSPGQRLDHAEAFQFGISLGDRVAVDAKVFGEGTDGGERLTGAQSARCGGGLDLIDQLEVDGHAGFEVDLEDQARLTVL
jgi:hypothetical protein